MSDTARAYTLAAALYKSIRDRPYIPTDFCVPMSLAAAEAVKLPTLRATVQENPESCTRRALSTFRDGQAIRIER